MFSKKINTNESNLFHRSLVSGSKFINKSGKLKQTKLCLSTSWNRNNTGHKKTVQLNINGNNKRLSGIINKSVKSESQVFQMPNQQIMQQANLNTTNSKKNISNHLNIQTRNIGNISVKSGRTFLAILGRVDFCLEMYKIYKDIKAIWDIYGNLLKITTGKQRYEYILLVRAIKGGPVLQAIYYDIFNILPSLRTEISVRVVGRFIGNSRMHIYKVQQIMNLTIAEEPFTRIQNVTSFSLLRNGTFGRTF